MRVLVLGAAAGGGFPQWNCGCPQCNLARAGDARAKPRTQAGAAVTADGETWLLVGASPDLRQQILANPPLAPTAPRHSPIAGAVLVSADVDGLTGLLTLREQQPLRLWAPAAILKILEENSLFRSLDPTLVQRIEIFPNVPIDVPHLTPRDQDTLGIRIAQGNWPHGAGRRLAALAAAKSAGSRPEWTKSTI